MTLDPKTPVLVGAATIEQRLDDPQAALEPVELMIAALGAAASDAGAPALLARADSIRVPRGFWNYSDPGRLVATRFGASGARTTLAEIGVLQTTLLGEAAAAIARGEESIALITGAEAKYRSLRAQIAGTEVASTEQTDVVPDRLLEPAREIWSPLEERLALLMPVTQYAMIETALRYAEGLSLEAHRREVAELWADFSRAAAENPHAWSRRALTAEAIAGAGDGNRMLAFPYTKLHNSQWNVDQAAGLILCSVAVARELGISEDRWVFPLAVAESNHMLPLSERAELHRSHGFRLAGARALADAGLAIEDVTRFELYSCFPIAVRVQAREMGIDAAHRLTVSGGMAFAGGPLNNFVFQSLVRMAEVLRRERTGAGMLTAVSGMLTKQGVSLWSASPPRGGFAYEDVTAAVAGATGAVEVVEGVESPARIATYTVLFEGGSPVRAAAICDLDDGRRTIAVTTDAAAAGAMTEREHCGAAVRVDRDQTLHL